MKNRALRLIEIALARHTLKLLPLLTTGMAVGANITATEPAVRGATLIRTEVPRGVDRTSASPGEAHHQRGASRGPWDANQLLAYTLRIAVCEYIP